ncbi:hypothetical protein ACP70R_003424 [Stipagrostis hirtigluma subsp. patula]
MDDIVQSPSNSTSCFFYLYQTSLYLWMPWVRTHICVMARFFLTGTWNLASFDWSGWFPKSEPVTKSSSTRNHTSRTPIPAFHPPPWGLSIFAGPFDRCMAATAQPACNRVQPLPAIAMGVLFEVRPSEARHTTPGISHGVHITGLSLLGPASAAGVVTVMAGVPEGDHMFPIGRLPSSSPEVEEHVVDVSPPVTLLGEYVLWHDSPDRSVRLHGDLIEPTPSDDELDEMYGLEDSDDEEEGFFCNADEGHERERVFSDDDEEETDLDDSDEEEDVSVDDDELPVVVLGGDEEEVADEAAGVVELEPLDEEDEAAGMEEFEPLDEEDEAARVVELEPLDEQGEAAGMVEFEPLDEEEAAERYDSDNGEDEGDDDGDEAEPPRKGRDDDEAAGESSKRASLSLIAVPVGSVVPEEEFLGASRFASVENTAGFMRIAAAEAAGGQEDKEIVVLYRYTRFSRTWSGQRGVEACKRTKLHRLRFAVPPAGDMASSLAWAGSSLGPLIYPALFRRQLQDLWSSMAEPAIDAIPPRATHLQVTVDVGILRCEDHTPERMEHMRGDLEAAMSEAWPAGSYHVSKNLHLPEPVWRDIDDGARPAKRRRVAEEEEEEDECPVCFEPLESGLAAWPGCRHVFHGACVEQTLAGREMCPLCRRKLSDPLIC